MDSENRSQFSNRRDILKLLTDDEIATVSRNETSAQLEDGVEYIDLGHLELGVRKAVAGSTSTRRVLQKKDVSEATWREILLLLVAHAAPEPTANE